MMPLHYMRPCRDPQVRRRLCKGGSRQDYELHLGDTQHGAAALNMGAQQGIWHHGPTPQSH